MSSPAIYPKFHAFDPSTGLPLVGGKLTTFAAGTSTPLATYSDAALTVPNSNPVILDANGEAVIYVGPSSYKFQLTKSDNSAVWTFDNYAPNLAFPSPTPSGWVQYTATALTFVNATTFTLAGDQTATFLVGRRIKTTITAGTAYGTISSSSFAAGVTTVVLINDSTALDSGLSAVFYGIETLALPSYLDPRTAVYAFWTGDITGYAAVTQLVAFTKVLDTLGELTGGTFTTKFPGKYLIQASVCSKDTVASSAQVLIIKQNGSVIAGGSSTASTANGYVQQTVPLTISLAAGDVITFFFNGTANTTVSAAGFTGGRATSINITRLP